MAAAGYGSGASVLNPGARVHDSIASGAAGRITRVLALGALVFLGVAVLATIMDHARQLTALAGFPRPLPIEATFTIQAGGVHWTTLLGNNLLFWGLWALFTPLIWWLAQRRVVSLPALRVTLWIAFGLVAATAQSSLTSMVKGTELAAAGPIGQLINRLSGSVQLNLVTFGLITGAVHALLYNRALQARRQEQAALQSQLARAELDNLRMQLHPHFFFNTLHTISALMSTDVPGARRVLVSLGELLRQTMDQATRAQVTLREELELALRYTEIQQARFGNRLVATFDVPELLLDAAVPSSLLQPLMENAVRHGIEPYAGPGTVTTSAQLAGDRVIITVRNQVAGRPSPAMPSLLPRSAGGLGLSNLRARLEHMYPGRYLFEYGHMDDSYTATLTIPFQHV